MMIIDTSIWVAMINQDDTCHQKAKKLLHNLYNDEIVLLDHVYSETLTVLRNKGGSKMEKEFKQILKELEIEFFATEKSMFNLADLIFVLYPKLSFIDCLLVGSAQHNGYRLVTFDKNLQKAWHTV